MNQITRQEMAKMIAKAYNLKLDNEADVSFTDASSFADWAKDEIEILASLGVVGGVGNGSFDPAGKVTRAQTAAFVHRAEVPTVRIDVPVKTAKVESVSAINATQVEVKFNKAVDKAAAEAVDGSAVSTVVSIGGVTLKSPTLSEDGKTLTLTSTAKIDVKNAAVVVNPVQTKEDALVSTTRFVSLLTYKDKVTPDIKSVESKTAASSASSVTVTFSEPIKSVGTVKIDGVTKTPTGFTAGDTSATFTNLDLDSTKSHTIQFVGLTDQADNKLTNKTVDFTVTKDTVAPTVTLSASQDKDNVIVVEFDKAVTTSSATTALVNGIVKGELLEAVTSATATPVDAVNGLAKKFEVAVTTPFASKTSRNLTVLVPAGIKDALGNKVASATKTVTLTKDVVAPEISSVKVVKDVDGKVTDF